MKNLFWKRVFVRFLYTSLAYCMQLFVCRRCISIFQLPCKKLGILKIILSITWGWGIIFDLICVLKSVSKQYFILFLKGGGITLNAENIDKNELCFRRQQVKKDRNYRYENALEPEYYDFSKCDIPKLECMSQPRNSWSRSCLDDTLRNTIRLHFIKKNIHTIWALYVYNLVPKFRQGGR